MEYQNTKICIKVNTICQKEKQIGRDKKIELRKQMVEEDERLNKVQIAKKRKRKKGRC